MDPSPTIAIVGRPNVGKSTLFNRLIKKRQAVVAEEAGTTRDRNIQKFLCNDFPCNLIDTGGLEYGKKENIEADVQSQAKLAIDDADIILFIVDIMHELTTDDFSAVEELRKSKKPVLLVANKADNSNLDNNSYNFFELGFGAPICISAIHNNGIEELRSSISKELSRLKFKKKSKEINPETGVTSVCILGKPNAGKSSLVNALLGSDKIIVSEIPGTTRDTIDTEVNYGNKRYNLIDTAGIRRRGKIEKGVEKFSILRCYNAIERSDIVILLIDGIKGITNQDCHIAEQALKEEKGLIIAINKIDLLKLNEIQQDQIIGKLRRKFSFVPWAPVIFISARDRKNIYELFNLIENIIKERNKRIKTAELNQFFQKIIHKHLPASAKIVKPKFMYGSQVDINPPKFLMFLKNAANLHFSYPRYLENEIRKEFGFTGTAINIKFKTSSSPKR